jgi:large subunit ribosomal protein L16
MLLSPRFSKYKKSQKGKAFNKIDNLLNFQNIKFDSLKLICSEHGRLSGKQINAISFTINKFMKKIGFVNFKIFPHHPISKKPIEVRMGKGKGNVSHWVFNVKPGFIICEIETSNKLQAYKALKSAQYRLPINTKIKNLIY